ncbi:hypothetical protein BSLG_008874 [Batrachochytrium salamandrivorans]|nr:hypothetical protein BSLG_008874 [Batrachochytrium salamandrivorans]
MSTAAVASIPVYSDGHDVAQDNLYKEEIKDSEKRLGSAQTHSKVNRAMALGATAKKPPTSGRRNTPMGAAGKGGMSTSATTRNMNKKGVSQQGTHSQSVSSTYAAPLTDTIAELGAEEDLAAEGQSNRDPQGKILNPLEDPFKLIEDEEMSGDSDLDIDGPESGKAIATMIADNTSLTTVYFEETTWVTKKLRIYLMHSSKTQLLDLSYNQIGNLGGLALGVALVANETLRDLNVSWNEMRSRGIGALLTGAKDNISLIYLNIRNNGIGENGAAVNQFLARNTTVTTLDIGFTRCDDPSMIAIAKAIEANRKNDTGPYT